MTAAPQPNDGFAWTQASERLALVCQPLAQVAPHFFTSRNWALGAPRAQHGDGAWIEVASAIGVDPSRLIRVRQVHGDSVVFATGPADILTEADVLVCRDPSLAIAVQAADCVPLLLADPRSGSVAAAHAGWRGLVQRVPRRAVQALCEKAGAAPADLIAALGPSVGACCYEVGSDVGEQFAQHGFEESELRAWFTEAPVQDAGNPPLPGLPASARPGHSFFDGWAAARAILLEAGVPAANIYEARLCTASHGALFNSYRREGALAGRIAAAIRPGLRR